MDVENTESKSEATKIFCFHLDELMMYEVTSKRYQPFRGKLCYELCTVLNLDFDTKAAKLATRTDLGQYHADNFLGLLQICSELVAFDNVGKSKRTKIENELIKERLSVFQLGLPQEDSNAVFAGMFAYLRLIATGSLAAAQKLMDGKHKVAINWYGGNLHAKKACAVNGCFINDSVLACLHLLEKFDRILHVSIGLDHCDGVEEAFYTSDRVTTVSFHSARCKTGSEDDTGHGAGKGYAMNYPLETGSFSDEHLVPFIENQLKKIVDVINPQVVVLIVSPDIIAGDNDEEFNLSLSGYASVVAAACGLGLPTLILGGACSSAEVAAKAWCAALGKLQHKDVIGMGIPEFEFRHHFQLGKYLLDVPARNVNSPDNVKSKLTEIDLRSLSRMSWLKKIKSESNNA